MNDLGKHIHRLVLALLVIGACGAAGVLIDLDHLITPVSLGQWPTLTNLGGRDLHFATLMVCGLLLCYNGACFIGFLLDTLNVLDAPNTLSTLDTLDTLVHPRVMRG